MNQIDFTISKYLSEEVCVECYSENINDNHVCDECALSRELGKSSSEAMKIVLSVITDMLERNERHIVSNGVEVTLRKRKVKGIGKEIAFDVWCNKYLYVGGVWL